MTTNSILAKSTGETLAEHTIRCLNAADILLENLPLDDDKINKIRKDLQISIATHDVGKAAEGFQKSIRDGKKRWGHRHEIISAAFASSHQLRDEIVFAILTHHRTIIDEKSSLPFEEIPLPPEPHPIWYEMAEEWRKNIPQFTVEWEKICKQIGREELDNFDLSLLRLSYNWLHRIPQEENIPFENRLYASLLRGLLMTCDHIASMEIKDINIPKIPQLSNISLELPNLYAFQNKAGLVNGNLILRAPTGSGKTLAALLWARRNQRKKGRLFYALPNIASINAMYLRLQKYFGKANVGLLHSRAASSIYTLLESDEYDSKLTRQRDAKVASSLSREMWYPIRVCTPHQLLRYTLHGKGWEMMFSEFPNSCFIFDEIHAYDPIITGLTIATAKYLTENNASCLFLSATMPAFLRKILQDEIPSITFLEPSPEDQSDKSILEKKRHILTVAEGNILTSLNNIKNSIEKVGSTLVVCNHVPSAQIVYEELGKEGATLLHSRFCRRDRDDKEKALESELPKVLVATQVVEVSLDIDFEQAYIEPAPIDALVQRLGRVNRRGKRPPANVTVFREQINKFPIYNKDLTKKSLEELESLSNPLSESDLVEATNRVYENGYEKEDWNSYNNALNHPLIKDYKKTLVAGVHNDWTEQVIEKADGTIDLLPESLRKEYDNFDSMGLWLEANRLFVPVRTQSLSYLHKYLDKSHEPWVIKRPYSKSLGLNLKAGDELE